MLLTSRRDAEAHSDFRRPRRLERSLILCEDCTRLVGPNGSGKSTLFRYITKEEKPDEGSVSIDRGVTLGYFRQDVGEASASSVLEEVMAGAGAVSTVAHQLKDLERNLADPVHADNLEALVKRFGEVQARFEELGGYALEARAREILRAPASNAQKRAGLHRALQGPRLPCGAGAIEGEEAR